MYQLVSENVKVFVYFLALTDIGKQFVSKLEFILGEGQFIFSIRFRQLWQPKQLALLQKG